MTTSLSRVEATRKIRIHSHKVVVAPGDRGTILERVGPFGRPRILWDNGQHIICDWSEIQEIVEYE